MSVIRTIAKNTLFNFINNASDQLISFGVGILLARYLGPEDYGLYAFLIWFLGFCVLFSNLGLGFMTTRFIAESLGRQNLNEAKNYINMALWVRIIAAVFITAIVIVFAGYWSKLYDHPDIEFLFIILSCGILPQVLSFLLTSIFAGFQKYEYSAYLMLCTNPLRAIGIIVIVIMDCGVQEVLFVNLIAWGVGVFVGLFLLRRLVPLDSVLSRPTLDKALRRSIKYSATMMGVLFINYFVARQAEILFLGMFHPGETVGFYTIAALIPTASLGLILLVFSQVLVPAVSEQFGRGNIEKIREIYITSARFVMMLGLPLAIGGIILAEPIITLVYGVEYAPVIKIMQILFLPYALLYMTDAATSVIYGMNHPSFILKMGIVLVIINISLNLWLTPIYGAIGAAIASSVPRIIVPPLYIRFASRKCQTNWPIKDTIRIIIATAIMGVVIFGLQRLIETPIISVALLIPLGFVVQMISLLFLGTIREDDLYTLKSVQHSLPNRFCSAFGRLIGLIEGFIRWRSKLNGNEYK